jgi:transposase-like protein
MGLRIATRTNPLETSEERERIKALERGNKDLRRTNEVLKLAGAFFARAEPGGAPHAALWTARRAPWQGGAYHRR